MKIRQIYEGDLLKRRNKFYEKSNLDSGLFVLFLGWDTSFTIGTVLYSNGNKGSYTLSFIMREWIKCSTAFVF